MTENTPQTTPDATQAIEVPLPGIPRTDFDLPTDVAVSTQFTPEAFKAWMDSEGEMFMVTLPGGKTFVLKVPSLHHEFFVAMMQQVRFALGTEVQAVRMTVVKGPPADVGADGQPVPPADGSARQSPAWAQPPNGAAHTEHQPPTEHVYHRDAHEARWPDNEDGSCGACGTPVDGVHERHCVKWLAMIRESRRAEERGPTTTGRARCDGSGKPAVNVTGKDRGFQRGQCIECGWAGKLTWAGDIRAHPNRNSDPLLNPVIKPLPRGDGPAFA